MESRTFPEATQEEIQDLCDALAKCAADWLSSRGLGAVKSSGVWDLPLAIADAVDAEHSIARHVMNRVRRTPISSL